MLDLHLCRQLRDVVSNDVHKQHLSITHFNSDTIVGRIPKHSVESYIKRFGSLFEEVKLEHCVYRNDGNVQKAENTILKFIANIVWTD